MGSFRSLDGHSLAGRTLGWEADEIADGLRLTYEAALAEAR